MAYRSGNAVPAQEPMPEHQPSQEPQIEVESTGKTGLLSKLKLIVGVFICFFLLGAVIYSNVQQLQINNEITAKQKEYVDLQSENVRMQSEIAGKTSNKNVQEYAEEVLGMRTIDASQIEYVQIQTSDVVEIPEEEQNVFVKIKIWFDNLVAYLRG